MSTTTKKKKKVGVDTDGTTGGVPDWQLAFAQDDPRPSAPKVNDTIIPPDDQRNIQKDQLDFVNQQMKQSLMHGNRGQHTRLGIDGAPEDANAARGLKAVFEGDNTGGHSWDQPASAYAHDSTSFHPQGNTNPDLQRNERHFQQQTQDKLYPERRPEAIAQKSRNQGIVDAANAADVAALGHSMRPDTVRPPAPPPMSPADLGQVFGGGGQGSPAVPPQMDTPDFNPSIGPFEPAPVPIGSVVPQDLGLASVPGVSPSPASSPPPAFASADQAYPPMPADQLPPPLPPAPVAPTAPPPYTPSESPPPRGQRGVDLGAIFGQGPPPPAAPAPPPPQSIQNHFKDNFGKSVVGKFLGLQNWSNTPDTTMQDIFPDLYPKRR